MSTLPWYLTRRIAAQAVCDVVNRHGMQSLGGETFDEAVKRFEDYVHEQEKLALVHYTYEDQQYTLAYDRIQYE